MTSTMTNDDNKAETNGPLAARLTRICLVFAAVALLVSGMVWSVWGLEAALVALVSAIACGTGAVLAHICSELPRGDMFIMIRLMSSSMVRVGVPLILLVVAKLAFPEHFARGMVYFVILFYVVGLLTDLQLQIKRFKTASSPSQTALAKPAGKLRGSDS